MYKILLSMKFLSHRLVNWICVVCVALAVTVLLAVMAIMGGFQHKLLESYQSISSDLIVNINRVRDVDESRMRDDIAEVPHVVASAYRFYTYGFIAIEGQINYGGSAGIKVFGIDPEQEFQATALRDHLLAVDYTPAVDNVDDPFNTESLQDPDRRPKPGVLLGEKLYQNLGVYRGQELTLTSAVFRERRAGESADDEAPPVDAKVMTFIVAGTFKTGMYEYDNHTVYVPADIEWEFLGEHGAGREIYVDLDDYDNAAKARELLDAALPREARIFTWEDMNRIFISAVQTEKMIQAIILSFMILLAGGSIMSVLTMTVVEKTRDVGSVKALGGTQFGVLGIFVLNGFVIGFLGSLLGLGLGILIINNINFIDSQIIAKIIGHRVFRPDVYVFDNIPTAYNPTAMAITIGITLGISFLASLVPAWKASRFKPVQALRYE